MKLIKTFGSTCALLALAGSALGQAPVDKTPVLHLSFDNVSGQTVLNGGKGGAGMNGTLNGGASIVGGGRFGNALQVTGANSWDASCRVANAVVPLHVQAGTSWTVAMWVKTTTQGGTWAYQGDGGWAQGHTTFAMVVNNGTTGVNGTAAGGVRHSSGWQQGTTPINDGNWHHVVLTCDGGTKVQYIDGVVDTWVANQWNNSTATGNQFWIGGAGTGQGDGQVGLEGLVDEAYVFDQALSASDVQQLFNNNTIPKVPVSVALTPNNGYRGQVFTVTATATPAVGVVTNAKINLSALGLSATANLVQSSPNVFTNTFTVPNNTNALIGAHVLTATVISTEPLVGSSGATFTVKALPPTNAIVLAQLTNTTVYQYTEASFRFGTTNDAPNQAPWPMTYTWYKNGVLVSTNPMGSSYTFLTVPADNGAQIYSIARVADTNYSHISVTSAVVTLTLTAGTPEYPGLKQEYFAGATRIDAEVGNVARGVVSFVTNAASAGGFGDNHARRYSGYFIPPTTDGYVFFLASDDDCDLFLSTDSNPTNKRLIAQETSWSATLAWQSGGSILSQKRSDQWTNNVGETPHAPGINLVAGQKYYIEAVMRNGGGGDNWAMTYQTLTELTADPSQPVDGTPSRMTVASNNIVFATFTGSTLTWAAQPSSVTVYEGNGTNFNSLAASDAEMTPVYQWYLNTGGGFTPISGANSAVLNLALIPNTYNGAQVQVVASLPLNTLSITSTPATITVLQSVTETGFLKLERWNGVSLTAVRNGTVGAPNFTLAIPAFGASVNNPSGQNDFIRRISGHFIPPTSGNYVFFTTGDDETEFYISTDATPGNKRLVAQNAGWNNGSMWAWGAVGGGGASASQMRSDQWSPDGGTTVPYAAGIPLVAGQKYYIEQLFHQGGGGANNAATFKLTTEADPVAGQETRFKGNVIAMNAVRINTVAYTQQPTNVAVQPMGYATFTANGTTDSAVQIGSVLGFESAQAGYLFFQWYKNGVAIPGANSRSITLGPLLPSDNGAQIHCSMRALGFANNSLTPIWTNSSTATVTVTGQAVFEPGIAWVNWWSNNTSRVTVETGSAGQPTYSFVSPSFESPWNGASWDNYVNRVHAYFTPTNTDGYVFFVNADDDANLFISTTSDPANKFLIAQEISWSNPLNWLTPGNGGSTAAQKRSDQFTPDGGTTFPGNPSGMGLQLTAGQRYWLEATHHDGAFGDNFAATVRGINDPEVTDGSRSRLTGNLIGTYVPRIPWVAFLQQPASQSVTSGGNPVTFTARGTNPPSIWIGTAGNPNDWLANPPTQSIQYQWYRNGVAIPGATSSSYTLLPVLPSDNGAQFVCAIRALGYADNSLNRIYSNSVPAVLTVATDTNAPTLAYAATFANTNQPHFVVSVTFNEWMDPATATNIANYSIPGVTITGISLDVNNRTVRLLVNQLPTLPVNVTVNGVKDLTGNTIANNSTTAIKSEKLTFTDVGTPTVDPAYPSFVSVTGNGGYIISAQGSDIWNAADAFNFAWELKTNDFDVVVRGVSQGHTHASAKAGLMVRESLDPSSRNWGVFNNPAPDSTSTVGANVIEANMRDTIGGATAGWRNLAGNIAPTYPNAWLRLKRTGNVLEAFASSNMVNWVALARYDTATNVNGALMAEVYVGLATSAHGNDGLEVPPYLFYNAAQYADYNSSFVPLAPAAQLTITRSGANVTISWTPTGGHLEWSPAIAGPGVNWQTVGTSNPSIVPIGTGSQFFRVVNP